LEAVPAPGHQPLKMDLGIAGKTAIVAAASKGIGKAVALALARENVNVAICARNYSDLLQTASEIESCYPAIRVLPVTADVTNAQDVKRLVKQGGGRIVNLVSIAAKQPIEGLILSNSIRAAVLGLAKTLSQELAAGSIPGLRESQLHHGHHHPG